MKSASKGLTVRSSVGMTKNNVWAIKMIYKGSGCFQFPEAVVTSTAIRSTKHGHYKFSLFYWSRNCNVQCNNFGSEGMPML